MSKNNESGILIVAQNKKAWHDYEILNTLETGLVLKGSEVKSIRDGGVNLKDSYVRVIKDEVFLIGCNISPYSHAPADAHPTVRDRKLLLHKKEIERLEAQVRQKGLTIVPLKLYFKKGRAKLEIGVGKGKKLYDKRESIKKREVERELRRMVKG